MVTAERFEKVNIDSLVPYARNARTHSKEQILQLRASIREFGFVNPVIVDKDLNVIAGHGRILAAKEEGITEAPCVFAEHLTEAQKRAYIIADNRLALNAGWDPEMLSVEIGDLQAAAFDLSILGFDDAELNKLMSGGEDVTEDNYDEPVPENPISRQGDLWLLGRHRLLCGDSTKAESYPVLMDGQKADLIVTDPPYNVAYEGTAGKIQNDNMADEKFHAFLLAAYRAMYANLVDGGSIYVFHADRETVNFRTAFAEAGFFCHQTCIWIKNAPVLGRCDYQYNHEPILVGWKPTAGHKWYADRKQRTTWNFDRPSRSEHHPTMKPVALVAHPIVNSSLTGSIVLDPFGGSGSTLIACEQTGRICYTVELDERYADVIANRYREFKGSDQGIFLLRSGEKIPFGEAQKLR